jgi:hypothetical protein
MKAKLILIPAVIALIFLCACKKGYRIRVSNYYLEKFDSVVIGSHAVSFTAIEPGSTTDYKSVTSGNHSVRFVTEDRHVFYALAPLPSGSGGDRTLQVDGLQAVTVLED